MTRREFRDTRVPKRREFITLLSDLTQWLKSLRPKHGAALLSGFGMPGIALLNVIHFTHGEAPSW